GRLKSGLLTSSNTCSSRSTVFRWSSSPTEQEASGGPPTTCSRASAPFAPDERSCRRSGGDVDRGTTDLSNSRRLRDTNVGSAIGAPIPASGEKRQVFAIATHFAGVADGIALAVCDDRITKSPRMSSSPAQNWTEPVESHAGEVRKLSTLLETSQALASTPDLKEGLRRVLEILGRHHGAIRSTVVLMNDE